MVGALVAAGLGAALVDVSAVVVLLATGARPLALAELFAGAAAVGAAGASCGTCLVAVQPSECPPEGIDAGELDGINNAGNCNGVAMGELCEGDGECGTTNSFNTCGNGYDIYRRVDCTTGEGALVSERLASNVKITPTNEKQARSLCLALACGDLDGRAEAQGGG